MLDFEKELYKEGFNLITGVDEVGRGCLLGDVVACAIIMPKNLIIDGVKDSKKLSEKKREYLYDIIVDKSLAVGIGQVDPNTIDKINIKESTKIAMKKAVLNLKDKDGNAVLPEYILVDAEKIDLGIPQKSIIKGDDLSHTISCASIVAKVYRDRLCLEWDNHYPGYNLKKNKGYGTKEHRENIINLGPTPIHRMTFLRNIIG
ncbi:MAG: ribonuclease HII [Tissierellaceae bacterium]|nr:ribonuclease HII [Tissierellaceae bacterium]